MLTDHEEQTVAAQFGVAPAQVRRDHLISHLLGVIGLHSADEVLFFGGTALSRTALPAGRLSEDIDLIALGNRTAVADKLERTLVAELRREFPGLRWLPPLTAVRDAEPAVLMSPDGVLVRIQLLRRTGYPAWPTERREMVQRYSDAPSARLIVPTVAAFAAWKTAAWADRAASRDLFDLKLLPMSARSIVKRLNCSGASGRPIGLRRKVCSGRRPVNRHGSGSFRGRRD